MTTWPKTTRATILARAKLGYGSGLGRVPYSQDTMVTVAGEQFRADCSGFVCHALGLTSGLRLAGWWGGLNTVTLVSSGALIEIDPSDLQPGDLAGTCGPGTGGDDGHITVFAGWDAQAGGDHYHQYEQCGGTTGPIYATRLWGYVRTAYRYAGIAVTPTKEEDLVTTQAEFKTLMDHYLLPKIVSDGKGGVVAKGTTTLPGALETLRNGQWAAQKDRTEMLDRLEKLEGSLAGLTKQLGAILAAVSK